MSTEAPQPGIYNTARISRRRLLTATAVGLGAAAALAACGGSENDPAKFTVYTDGYVDRTRKVPEMFANIQPTKIIIKTDGTDPIIRAGQAAFEPEKGYRFSFHPRTTSENSGTLKVHINGGYAQRDTKLRAAIVSPEHGELIVESVERTSAGNSSFEDNVPPENRNNEAYEIHLRDKLHQNLLKRILEDGVTVYIQEVDSKTYKPIDYLSRVLKISTK